MAGCVPQEDSEGADWPRWLSQVTQLPHGKTRDLLFHGYVSQLFHDTVCLNCLQQH